MRYTWATLVASICCLNACQATKQECQGMQVFQSMFTEVRQKAEELAAMIQILQGKLDSSVDLNCSGNAVGNRKNVLKLNVTYYHFEYGTCNLTQSRDDSSDWVLDNTYPDHTMRSKMGHTLRTYRPGNYLMRVTTRTFNPANAYCIRFYYRAESRAYGKLNVYIQEGNLRGISVFSLTHVPSKSWTLAEFSPNPEYLRRPFQIVLEAEHLTQYVYVDDLSVYNAGCSSEGVQTPICPPGSVVNNVMGRTTCYVFHMEAKTYKDAMLTCKSLWPQASLVSIESPIEQQFISHMINQSDDMSMTSEFGLWTSGNDFDHENSFTWSGQTHLIKFNYTHWYPGQPNNIAGEQDCVVILYPKQNHEWGDVSCNERHSFICEINF
ncbi:MAM and LDL-receptor class A domain-containing protein 1-like isoform X2 [Ostrea edulis]|nr:MAM and LDL-receptor class A domain-containing protein 1-like isoform X2 [Ostrea edulis]